MGRYIHNITIFLKNYEASINISVTAFLFRVTCRMLKRGDWDGENHSPQWRFIRVVISMILHLEEHFKQIAFPYLCLKYAIWQRN